MNGNDNFNIFIVGPDSPPSGNTDSSIDGTIPIADPSVYHPDLIRDPYDNSLFASSARPYLNINPVDPYTYHDGSDGTSPSPYTSPGNYSPSSPGTLNDMAQSFDNINLDEGYTQLEYIRLAEESHLQISVDTEEQDLDVFFSSLLADTDSSDVSQDNMLTSADIGSFVPTDQGFENHYSHENVQPLSRAHIRSNSDTQLPLPGDYSQISVVTPDIASSDTIRQSNFPTPSVRQRGRSVGSSTESICLRGSREGRSMPRRSSPYPQPQEVQGTNSDSTGHLAVPDQSAGKLMRRHSFAQEYCFAQATHVAPPVSDYSESSSGTLSRSNSARSVASEAGIRASEARRRKEAIFECEHCGRRLTTNHNLKNHVNAHFNIKQYQCHRCGKKFTTQSVHARHLKTCKASEPSSGSSGSSVSECQ